MIFINFKTYEESTGEKGLALAKLLEEASNETGIPVIPVVAPYDVKEIASVINIPVWSQKVDGVEYGAHTGSVLPEAMARDGAKGTFLNHSENRFVSFEELTAAHTRAKEVGLTTLIFAKDLEELRKNLTLKPDYISYEPPEFIGSTSTSVSEEKPEVISEAVAIANEAGIPLIVGAGIKSAEDVKIALSLGAAGFAIAKSIVTASNPKTEILELMKGYKK